jgi:hypothetical protein
MYINRSLDAVRILQNRGDIEGRQENASEVMLSE